MFDINNYYLGVILAHPSYFRNPESKRRRLENKECDPFFSLTFEQAIILGTATLLRRQGDNYYDEDYSRYRNELCYQEKVTNQYGITLAFFKPFSEYFTEEPKIFEEESLFFEEEIVEELLNHSYYVVYSKLTREYHVIINDEEVLSLVREDYLKDLLGDKRFDIMIKKKKKR